MLKKEELLKLPQTRKPTAARLKKAYNAAKQNRTAILSTAVADANGERILCIDCRINGVILYRAFFDGQKIRKLDDAGKPERKSFYRLCAGYARYIDWNSAADEQRVLQYFGIEAGLTQSAGELVSLIEHGKIQNGAFTASHAGSAGGYTPEELAIEPPKGWKESCIQGGMPAKHILLMECVWVADPMTGMKERMDKCTCSACGAVWYDYRHRYGDGERIYCPECEEKVHCRRKRAHRTPHSAACSLLHFYKKGRTECAAAWDVEFWVDNDAKEHWHATPSVLYAWGPYGNYAYKRYESYGMNNARFYTNEWYEQEKMTDNWMHRFPSVVHDDANIDLTGTVLENSRLKEFMLAMRESPVRYATASRNNPVLEAFCAEGDYETPFRVISGQLRLKKGETRPSAALGLTRPEYARYKAEQWSLTAYKLYIQARAFGEQPQAQELREMSEAMKGHLERLKKENPVKLYHYLARAARHAQKKGEKGSGTPRHCLSLWLDYLGMASEQKVELSQKERYPYDLKNAHDRMTAAVNARKDAEVLKKQAAKAEKFTAMWERIHWADFADEKYCIMAAKSTAELLAEGRALDHCVGTYTDAFIEGRVIFFLRKAESPEKPFFTLNLNIKTGRIIQLQGNHNCQPPQEVKDWANGWLDKIWAKGRPRKKTAAA